MSGSGSAVTRSVVYNARQELVQPILSANVYQPGYHRVRRGSPSRVHSPFSYYHQRGYDRAPTSTRGSGIAKYSPTEHSSAEVHRVHSPVNARFGMARVYKYHQRQRWQPRPSQPSALLGCTVLCNHVCGTRIPPRGRLLDQRRGA